MSIIEDIKQQVIDGSGRKTKELVQQAINQGVEVSAIVNEGLIGGMSYMGNKFKKNEVYVPEVLMAARAMQQGMDIVKPLIAQSGVKEKGIIVIGAVKGDLHDIGTNLVTMMLQGAGYKVINLGVDITTEKFIKAIKEHKPHIVGLAALLTSTMPDMKATVDDLKPYRDKIKIMIGGAPVTAEFAREIGADSYAPDAATAVDEADALLN
jgi:5-methyltetrahydrofolate--homocysteine methyltransferase